jgi:hypothetical protein
LGNGPEQTFYCNVPEMLLANETGHPGSAPYGGDEDGLSQLEKKLESSAILDLNY